MPEMRAFLLAATSLLAGCVASAAARETPAAENVVKVEFSVENAAGESAAEFHAGDTVHFMFRVHNTGNTPRTLEFTFPPHRVAVFPAKGDEPVWQAFEGRMFPQVMRARELAGSESFTFAVDWELHAVAPGAYRVQPAFIGFVRGGSLQRTLPAVSINIE